MAQIKAQSTSFEKTEYVNIFDKLLFEYGL